MIMDNEYKKFGISDNDIVNAALGDFDDFVQPVEKQPDTTHTSKSKTNIVDKVSESKDKTAVSISHEPENKLPKIEKFSNIYVVDFVKSLFKKEKVGVCIWLILNMLLVSLPMGIPYFAQYEYDGAEAVLMGLAGVAVGMVFYIITLVIAMSPVGETILRWQNKCKPIKDINIKNRLEPIFNRVYEKAKTHCPSISDKVRLFISRDDSPNAFATGRRTICVTQGLLELSDDEIEGVLAHEFGHLAHKDTDVILAVSVGNMIVVGTITVINIISNIAIKIADFFSKNDTGAIMYNIINAFFYVIVFLWTKLGVLLCMHSSRKNEYAADNFAVDLNYKDDLINALTELDEGDFSKPKGLWAALHDSHPHTADRIMLMNEYDSTR